MVSVPSETCVLVKKIRLRGKMMFHRMKVRAKTVNVTVDNEAKLGRAIKIPLWVVANNVVKPVCFWFW